MNIIEALKKENLNIHYGDKTLFFDTVFEEWKVIQHKGTRYEVLISTLNEEDAIKMLMS